MSRLICVVLSVALSGFASSLYATTIWLSGSNRVYVVDGTTNQAVTLAADEQVLQIVANPDDSAWLLSKHRLVKRSRNGALQVAIDLSTIGINVAGLFALDSIDGSVWLADGSGSDVVQLNAQGQRIGKWNTPGTVRAMALGLDQTVWFLGNKQLWHFSSAGTQLAAIDLRTYTQSEPKLLVADLIGVWLWFDGEKQLVRLDGHQPAAAPIKVTLSSNVDYTVIDARTGSLWTIAGSMLASYDDHGRPLTSTDPAALGIKKIASLAFDPATRSLWVGHAKSASRFGPTGQRTATVTVAETVSAIGVAAFDLRPSITLATPSNGLLTNNAFIPLTATLGANCNGSPCGFAPGFYSAYSIAALLNNALLSGSFAIDPTTGIARFVPGSRWPEGLNNLSLRVTDSFGRTSPLVESRFTVDTIPPKFTNISPADGAAVLTPNVTIRGNVDEVAALRLIWANGAANAQGTRFDFPVTLKPGLNSFELSATDAAGNTSTTSLKVTLQLSIQIQITSPQVSQTVNGSTVIVTGDIFGPPNTGVSVNGTVAAVRDNRFYAVVPLLEGVNTVTAQAITLKGESATDAVTFTVAASTTSAALRDVRVDISRLTGLTPTNLEVNVSNDKSVVNSISIDFNGDGVNEVQATPTVGLNTYAYRYATAGIFQVRVTLRDSLGNSRVDTYPVVIATVAELDQRLRVVLDDMRAAMRRGDIDGALKYFTPSAAIQYRAVFEDIGANLANVADQIGTINDGYLSNGFAEYLMVRQKPDGKQGYLIYLIQMPDGVWRVAQM